MSARMTPLVLIVDDDKFFLEFYRAELSQYNLETEFAQDGADGLKKALELKPDIILLDIILPKMDGFEVLTQIRANADTKDTPVLIVSTLGTDSDKEKLLALGATRTFNKLQDLPKDVAKYVQESLKIGFVTETIPDKTNQGTFLAKEQIESLFHESLEEIDRSFAKLFSQSGQVEDLNVAMIPGTEFAKRITELSRQAGSIFIYSDIEAVVPGLAIMVMKRDDTLAMIKLIGESVATRDLGLSESDRVVEEFFNIVINAFLNKLSSSIHGQMLLQSPVMTNARLALPLLESLPAMKDEKSSVIFFEEAYSLKEIDVSFSIYITFGSDMFKKEVKAE
ncbi:MAG: response regulator [Candidatus Uhrbacteria bacterium]